MAEDVDGDFNEAVWLEVRLVDFLEALRTIRPKGAPQPGRHALQIGLVGNEAVFGLNDRETRCDGRGHWPGIARFDLRYALSFLRFKPAADPLRIEFSDGRLRIESLRFPARWVGASALVSQISMDAHFMGADEPAPEPELFCPACGKKSGMPLGEWPTRLPPPPPIELPDGVDSAALIAHRCVRCGHLWLELAEPPQQPLRLA